MGSGNGSRTYVSQTDIPRVSLDQALRIPQAIADNYALEPTKPLRVAQALDLTPTGGRFKALCGAAIGYGLTDGGARAETIELTDLGRRIVAPREEGDSKRAKREAALRPTVVRRFLEKYNGSKLPPGKIAGNVLADEMGVPRSRVEKAYEIIVETAKDMGFLLETSGDQYVDLDRAPGSAEVDDGSDDHKFAEADDDSDGAGQGGPTNRIEDLFDASEKETNGVEKSSGLRNRKVFISHGKNRKIVEQIKELLEFGDFEPVVSVEKESVSKPVPKKVMDDMRSCAAGIIHVGTERKVMDQEGTEHRMLNPNVLIEIGGAMALYEERFILLVEQGVELPSNLQGLYEVWYEGSELDHDATMRLLKAFNEFKK